MEDKRYYFVVFEIIFNPLNVFRLALCATLLVKDTYYVFFLVFNAE